MLSQKENKNKKKSRKGRGPKRTGKKGRKSVEMLFKSGNESKENKMHTMKRSTAEMT